jgi:hypothetical protein
MHTAPRALCELSACLRDIIQMLAVFSTSTIPIRQPTADHADHPPGATWNKSRYNVCPSSVFAVFFRKMSASPAP